MGQGRRCLAAMVVSLLAFTAVAGELPNTRSADQPRPAALETAAGLHEPAPAPAFNIIEWMPEPIAGEPAPAARKKVFDKKFAVLAGLAAGLTVADFEMTQRCLQRRTCTEADPLMPTSHAGMYVTNIPLNAALFWWSYRRKEQGKRLWWLAPLMVVGSHAVGVGTNLRFVGK